jgi:hypothetical protein
MDFLLECEFMISGKWIPTLWRIFFSPYSILKIEVASLSKMLVRICKTTRNHIPEDHILSNHCGKDYLKVLNYGQNFVQFTNTSTLNCNISFTYIPSCNYYSIYIFQSMRHIQDIHTHRDIYLLLILYRLRTISVLKCMNSLNMAPYIEINKVSSSCFI